jgi:broad specificity phosphatase PhoE
MASRLTLISHAATPAVRAAAFPLDETIDGAGRRDAEVLAATLPAFVTAWTGPSKRTVETAAALNLNASVEAELRDLDLGRWAGRTLGEVERQEPQEIARWLSDPDSVPHGGESIGHLTERVSQWLTGLSQLRGRSAAVTHPAVIRAAVVAAIEASPVSFWRIDIAPLSIVELSCNGRRWTLRSIK